MFFRSLSSVICLLALACESTPPAQSPEATAPSEDAASSDATASGGSTSPDAAPDAGTPATTTSGELTVGKSTDGVTLTNVEVKTIGERTVVTISFDGKGAAPSTKASWGAEARRVVLDFSGVRDVKTPVGIPLVTGEDGSVRAQPRAVDVGLVADMGRYFLGDDSAIRVELGLKAAGRFSLQEVSGKRAVELTIDEVK